MASLSGMRLGAVGLYVGKNCSGLSRRSVAPNFAKVGILGTNHVAHLTATHGEPYPRKKPWPYKTRGYNTFYELFDITTKRLNDNSKIIVVEGNMATNKQKLAEDIAREFDMVYVPGPKFDDIFKINWSDYDVREIDEQLPESAKSWDLKRFYTDPNAKRSRVGLSQVYLYAERVFSYAKAVHHMLSTGQGVVLVRSPYSDHVYADTMRKFDYFTPEGIKFYYMIRDNSLCEFYNPHCTIYLDAPLSMVRDNIKKRNIPHEVNSKVLTDEYIQAIGDQYKTKLLPELKRTGEVLQYDLTEGLDLEIIVEDLERLDLDKAPEEFPQRFLEWTTLKEDEWALHRKMTGYEQYLYTLFSRPLPIEAPELLLSSEVADKWRAVLREQPGYLYAKGFDPAENNVLFRL